MTNISDTSAATEAPKKLGTFAGVFTPSILTILGIILFLRLGFVVGSAGLMKALVIIAIANAISVLTSISLSAVATNLTVKGGGDYYLISRTLGVEFGGALGLVLFLAQSVSIAFYCIGFGEAVAAFSDHPLATPQWIALGAVAVLFVFAWLGADWATRFQYGVMVCLVAALTSFYVGGLTHWDAANIAANWHAPENGQAFWVLFAIFFPAVTGFTQGVSMSGDLADPVRSLPLGTFLAVGVSIFVYFTVAVLLAGTLSPDLLATDNSAMKRASQWGLLIDAGVVAATLSSAMASFLGAPRILQSLAGDRVFPRLTFFAKGYGVSNNPRRAVLLAAAIALATIALGNLNVVASVVSMFFLISYGLLNYATYFEAKSESPSFRPRFRYFSRWLSLLGALACLGVMLAIDPVTGIVAASIISAIYQYLKRTAGPARWADSQRSYHLQQIRNHLQGLAEDPEHPRDWRPNILALTNDSDRRAQLLQLADWIAGRSGFVTAARVIESTGGPMMKQQKEQEQALRDDIRQLRLTVFSKVVCAPDQQSALATLVQSHGIGPLHANTIMLNWFSPEIEQDRQRLERMNRNLRGALHLGCNLIMCRTNEQILVSYEEPGRRRRRIDVWWQEDATGRLSLLLAHLMKRSSQWQDAVITVLSVEERFRSSEGRFLLKAQIDTARIDAELDLPEPADIQHVVERSAHSDMVFLPFRIKKNQMVSLFNRPAFELLRWMTTTALIQAAEDIDLDAAPESGEAGVRAQMQDALEEARNNADRAEKEAEEALKKAEQDQIRLAEILSAAGPDQTRTDQIREGEKAAEQSRSEAEKMARRAAKFRTKADAAQTELDQNDPAAGAGDKGEGA